MRIHGCCPHDPLHSSHLFRQKRKPSVLASIALESKKTLLLFADTRRGVVQILIGNSVIHIDRL